MTAPTIPGHRFVGLIDEGGFATVYRYIRESLGKEVAIKVLRAEALGHLTVEEFRAEALIMARLSGHPNIVTIHDHGTVDDGRPYLVMEYCPPPNLKVRLEQERLGVPFVLEVGVLIAGAVETAHRAGVLHHDIKPANILLDGYGPKLTDFGISEMLGGTGRAAEGVSVPWASLEALEGRSTNSRSDVYSLAATLYTALTGRWPYEVSGSANDLPALMSRMRTGTPQPLRRGDVPTRLEQALRRSLHPDPDRRHQSALDLADDLRRAAPPGWGVPQPQVPEETARAAKELTLAMPHRLGGQDQPHLATHRGPVLASPPSAGSRSPAGGASTGTGTVPRSRVPVHSDGSALDLTGLREPTPIPALPRSRRAGVIGSALAVATAAAAVAVLTLARPGSDGQPGPTETTRAFDPVAVNAGQPGPPEWLRTAKNAVLTWGEPADHQAGDQYQWRQVTATGEPVGSAATTQERTATITGVAASAQVCAQVWVVRTGVPSNRVLFTCDPEAG